MRWILLGYIKMFYLVCNHRRYWTLYSVSVRVSLRFKFAALSNFEEWISFRSLLDGHWTTWTFSSCTQPFKNEANFVQYWFLRCYMQNFICTCRCCINCLHEDSGSANVLAVHVCLSCSQIAFVSSSLMLSNDRQPASIAQRALLWGIARFWMYWRQCLRGPRCWPDR